VDFAKQHGFGIIMEDFKGMRKRVNKGRTLNRRLHSWNFRKLQSCIEYKAKLEGLPVVYVNPKGDFKPMPDMWWKISIEWAQACEVWIRER
jgi:putative transposase